MPRGSEHASYRRVATGLVTVDGQDVPALVELHVAKDQPRSALYGDGADPLGFVDDQGSITMTVTVNAVIPAEDLYEWIIESDWLPHVQIDRPGPEEN